MVLESYYTVYFSNYSDSSNSTKFQIDNITQNIVYGKL